MDIGAVEKRPDRAGESERGPVIWIVNKTVRYGEADDLQIRSATRMLVVMKEAHRIQQFIHIVKMPIFPVKCSEIKS